MLSGHDRLDNGLLHGPALLVAGLWTKVWKPEPAGQLLAGVVPFPTPLAGRAGAGRVSQPAYQRTGFGELMPYPGWHNRVSAGHRQPGQRIGQPPPVAGRIRQDFLQHCTALGETGRVREPVADRPIGINVGRSGCPSQGCEKSVKAGPSIVRAGQPMPGGQQVGIRLPQRFLLVAENVQGEAGVQLRVVDASAFELSVLIVLDQMMIGVARESQGIEP